MKGSNFHLGKRNL